jgi:molybdenum cofactor guanylyltransferase
VANITAQHRRTVKRNKFRASRKSAQDPAVLPRISTRRASADRTTSACEICILAGGSSTRMGRDKSRLWLGGVSLITRLRALARALHLPARVIRHDVVPRCGPLGGILTALKSTSTDATIFLSCDMPFVTSSLLEELLAQSKSSQQSVFVGRDGVVGFPFLLFRESVSIVVQLWSRKELSLQQLARACQAEVIHLPPRRQWELLNVNTPADWRRARDLWQALKQ